MIDKVPQYIAIIGPTASGKSQKALQLAQECKGEIINCDSLALYRGFDIGTAKPSLEQQQQVKHHLIDRLSWDMSWGAGDYAAAARACIKDITKRQKVAIVCGGSSMYFRALIGESFHNLPHDANLRQQLQKLSTQELYAKLQQLDPERALQIHPNDHFRLTRAIEIISLTGKKTSELTTPKKPDFMPQKTIILQPQREALRQRISLRTQKLLALGLITEVEKLLALGVSQECKPMNSIGYRQTVAYLQGKITKEQLYPTIFKATWTYARKQRLYCRQLSSLLDNSKLLMP